MAALSVESSLSVRGNLGAIFIGNIFMTMIFTATTIQTYIYYRRNVSDTLIMKNVVMILWILDALQFSIITSTVYFYSIDRYGNPSSLDYFNWGLAISMPLCGLSDLIVTSVYAARIWKFSDGAPLAKVVMGAITLGEIFCLVGDVGITVLTLRAPRTIAAYRLNYSWSWYMAFGARAAVDVVIAISIVTMMYRSGAAFKSTNSVIRIIIAYSINTCALTTVISLLSVFLFAALPHSFSGFAASMVLPGLITNSLLALLNSRHSMRKQLGIPDTRLASIHISRILPPSIPASAPLDSEIDMRQTHELGLQSFAVLKAKQTFGSVGSEAVTV